MVSVVVVSSPNGDAAPDSVQRRVFEELPGVDLDLESLVPLGRRALPYVWVRGPTRDEFGPVVGEFPEVSSVEVLERVEGATLYRLEWTVDSPALDCIAGAGGAVMDARGTAEGWELSIRFERSDDAAAFQRCCRERGVPLEVERIGTVRDGWSVDGSPVTPAQREALETAYDRGYFERPRETTQVAIADELGISAAATGSRLRRGTAKLVESFLEDC